MILYGASGHGKVVKSASTIDVLLFFDDNPLLHSWGGVNVSTYRADYLPDELVAISIGNNKIRKRVSKGISHDFATVIAQSAEIDTSCSIGIGAQILQSALIQASARIGEHVIVNSMASIDHDCKVGNYCHIAPNATLCGNVTLGEGVLIGAGSVVIPGISIGDWAIVGAGSIVTKNVPPASLVYGNPARQVNQ